ncbi:hypothetical protein HanIR_Chr10g0480271 [Helianthus annuus]|nr:hypothetical protein HanIR_Chr10g0480271 [Helianthus annuus]
MMNQRVKRLWRIMNRSYERTTNNAKEAVTKKMNMHIDDQLNKDAPFIRDSRRHQLPSNIQLE